MRCNRTGLIRDQEEYLCLVGPAWVLREWSVPALVRLLRGRESFAALSRATRRPVRVRAELRDERWPFVYGRSRLREVDACDVNAPGRIWELAQ